MQRLREKGRPEATLCADVAQLKHAAGDIRYRVRLRMRIATCRRQAGVSEDVGHDDCRQTQVIELGRRCRMPKDGMPSRPPGAWCKSCNSRDLGLVGDSRNVL